MPNTKKLKNADIKDKDIQGRYVGICPGVILAGGDFEESIIGFSIDKNGIKMDSVLCLDDKKLDCVIHFSPKWIFSLKGWGFDHCLSIRQHAKSELAQLIIDTSAGQKIRSEKDPKKSVEINASMILGEGMPIPLGLLIHKDKHQDPEQAVADIYDILQEAKDAENIPVAEESSHLLPINITEAKKVVEEDKNTPAIKEILKTIEHNLWTGSEEEILERMEIISIATQSRYPFIQLAAIDTFSIGARVTSGIKVLEKYFERIDLSKTHPNLIEAAAKATVYLLYECHRFVKNHHFLESIYNTCDIEEILELTDGILLPEVFEAMENISKVKAQRDWSLEQHKTLRDILKKVFDKSKEYNSYPPIINICSEGLEEYKF